MGNEPKYDQRLLDICDRQAHGQISHRRCASPQGAGTMRGYLAVPTGKDEKVPGVVVVHENHGFHDDATPRYDKEAAEPAWRPTIEFFRHNLV